MHARHRSPGNGYRSASMGIGLAASRVSPEPSGRGPGSYNSEYRNFKRGFGRGHGHPKSYQPPLPTPRKGVDLFMEAGRLAAEYLVSQGLLPASVLSAKWQNDNLKRQVGDFQDFRTPEGDNLHHPPDGRTSALSRLGNSASDAGFGRKRYADDYSLPGSRNHFKGRRKEGYFRNNSSEWSREYGRTGSWSDRSRASPEMENDEDCVSEHHEEQQGSKDVVNGLNKSGLGDFVPKVAGGVESELGKYNLQDEMGTKASAPGSGRDPQCDTGRDLSKRTDDSINPIAGALNLKEGSDSDETGKSGALDKSPVQDVAAVDDSSSKSTTDLLALCKFAKVPTKTRSSLTFKGSKVDLMSKNEENASVASLHSLSEVLPEDDSLSGSYNNLISNETNDLNCRDAETSRDLCEKAVEDVGELSGVCDLELGKVTRSQSFPDTVLLHENEQELIWGMPLQRSISLIKERGEKHLLDQTDLGEGIKKPREWLQGVGVKHDEYFHLSNIGEKKGSSEEGRVSSSEKDNITVGQDSNISNSLFPNDGEEPNIKYTQEKQLFPGSFKICDLNLMESSDINENHHDDPTIGYPASSETRKEAAAAIDMDLSINNSDHSAGSSRYTSNVKEIEIIDLEYDSNQEVKTLDNLERKSEPMAVNVNSSMTDVPDQFDGLTITEFLRNFSGCSHVPEDINPHSLPMDNISSLPNEDMNPLQGGMGLPNGEGTLGDDDSIYVSLGELPISFLPTWDQPPASGYEKPF